MLLGNCEYYSLTRRGLSLDAGCDSDMPCPSGPLYGDEKAVTVWVNTNADGARMVFPGAKVLEYAARHHTTVAELIAGAHR